MASSVNLGEQLEAFIDEAVKNGRYGSRSEVLREGVRLVQEREAKWARFEVEIRKGLDSANRGELIPAEEAFAELDRYIEDVIARQARDEAA
ncbi:MAG TPA: type II toxin-antitoxin system ParD family antitoxin [Allosphingosinicella sp.]|jgi:antitoxin ParD1/3/4